MSDHVTNTFYNIPHGHDTSLVEMSREKTLTHTNKHHMKTKTIHENTLFMSSIISIDEYK
jgi:hypothetical protein